MHGSPEMRLIATLFVCSLFGCASRRAPLLPITPAVETTHTGYITLQAGWRLRVITPILKSGGYQLKTTVSNQTGSNITLSAGPDFIGYETAYYAVEQTPPGAIRVKFLSAEASKDGVKRAETKPLVRLFDTPRNARFVRLIYLKRVSESDHDMAVLSASRQDALEMATRNVETDPAACKIHAQILLHLGSGRNRSTGGNA